MAIILLPAGGGISPYQAAVEGGYEGSEEEFNAILAMIPDEEKQTAWDGKAEDADLTAHANDGDVHVTAEQKQSWDGKADAADLSDIQGALVNETTDRSAADADLQNKINSEVSARQSAITAAVNSEAQERQAADATLQALIASAGGCKIETGSYVGTGVSGSANACSLTFGFQPKIIYITGTNSIGYPNGALLYVRTFHAANDETDLSSYRAYGYSYGASSDWGVTGTSDSCYSSMNGNTFSWYYRVASKPVHQINESGVTYNWIAIG